MAGAAGGRTSPGASAGRPRPPARRFQFCLPLRPRPPRAPRRPGPSASPPPAPRLRPLSGSPAPRLSRPGFVCSLTWRLAPPGCGISAGARGARVLSLLLGALPGGEDAAGRPGSSGACVRLGCPRMRSECAQRPARLSRGRGPARAGIPAPRPRAWGHSGSFGDAVPHARTARVPGDAARYAQAVRLCLGGGGFVSRPNLLGSPGRHPSPTLLLSGFKLQRHSEPLRERPVPASPTCLALPGARGTGRRPRAPARPAVPGLQPLRCPFASPAGGGRRAVWAAARPPLRWAPRGSKVWGGGSAGPGLGGRHRGPRPRAIWTPGASAFEVVRGTLCSPGLSGSGPGGGLRLRCL